MFAGIALLLQLYERGYLIPTSPTATHPARSSLTSLLSRPVLDICFVSCTTAAAVTRFAPSLNCVSCWHPVLLSPPTALNMHAIMEHGAVSGLRAASVRRLPVRFKHFKAQLTAAADTSCSRAVCHVAAEDTHPDIVQCCSLVGYALDQHSASVAQLLSHAHLLQSPACSQYTYEDGSERHPRFELATLQTTDTREITMCLYYVVSCPVLTALRLVQCARLNSVMPPPSDRLNSLARAAAADSPKQQLSRHSLLSCGGQPARSPCRTLQDISAFSVQTCHSHGYRRHITCGLQPSYQYIEFDS
jgi:hypothetical protein